MSKIGGFFVTSRSAPYVLSKRNEEGSYKYDADIMGVGMQKQAALQDLEKTYESTINKAYGSYLANQKTIANTNMGQGYKELYEQAELENLLAQGAEAAANVSQVKSQLLGQEAEAINSIQQQYATETANLDRVARSMSDYLNYIGSLEGGYDYLSKLSGNTVTKDTLAEDLYEELFTAQPQGLSSSEDPDVKGLSYSQWLHDQMKETDEDVAFEQWLFSGGGWQDFRKSIGMTDQTEFGEKYAEIEQGRETERNEKLQKIEDDKVNELKGQLNFKGNWEQSQDVSNDIIGKRALQESLGITIPDNITGPTKVTNRLGQSFIVIPKNGKLQVVNDNYQGKVSTGSAGSNVKGGGVQMDSKTSIDISRALDTESKLDSGEWRKGDIIKYNGRYYRIVDVRAKWNRSGKVGHVSYQQVNFNY